MTLVGTYWHLEIKNDAGRWVHFATVSGDTREQANAATLEHYGRWMRVKGSEWRLTKEEPLVAKDPNVP